MYRSVKRNELFSGVRGKVLAELCAAEDRLTGGQVAMKCAASRSNTNRILNELVDAGIVSRRVHPSVYMVEMCDNATARAVAVLHDATSTTDDMGDAVQLLRTEVPRWTAQHQSSLCLAGAETRV